MADNNKEEQSIEEGLDNELDPSITNLEEESWRFLHITTDIVSKLAKKIQKRITEIGMVLLQYQVTYIHVINKAKKSSKGPMAANQQQGEKTSQRQQ